MGGFKGLGIGGFKSLGIGGFKGLGIGGFKRLGIGGLKGLGIGGFKGLGIGGFKGLGIGGFKGLGIGVWVWGYSSPRSSQSRFLGHSMGAEQGPGTRSWNKVPQPPGDNETNRLIVHSLLEVLQESISFVHSFMNSTTGIRG